MIWSWNFWFFQQQEGQLEVQFKMDFLNSHSTGLAQEIECDHQFCLTIWLFIDFTEQFYLSSCMNHCSRKYFTCPVLTVGCTWRQQFYRRDMSHFMTKPTKWLCAQRRLRSALASTQSDQSSPSVWRKLGFLPTHWAHSKDSDQTGRMPRLIWVFAGRKAILLVLSWGGSYSPVTISILTTVF